MSDTPNAPADDLLELAPEDGAPERSGAAGAARPWYVMVVDDDDDVHATTRFALNGARVLGRPIELVHAHSAAEAWARLGEVKDIAVALIDVVMESPDAGLRLVRELREAGMREMRIVLRTGQPGYAPEVSVISSYEIDDYRTKSELTQTRLLTVLTATIRAYDQIRTISRSRAGLEMIVESATKLFTRTNLELFSRGVLTQIAALLRVAPNGLVCVDGGQGADDGAMIVSAAGSFAVYAGRPLSALPDRALARLIAEFPRQGDPVVEGGFMMMHFGTEPGRALIAVIEAGGEIADADRTLLRLFATNIAIGFENQALIDRLDHMAHVDPVFDVPNLNAFETALGERVAVDPVDGRIALVHLESHASIVAGYGLRIARNYLRAIYAALADFEMGALVVAMIGDGTFALIGEKTHLDPARLHALVTAAYTTDGVEIASTATAALLDLDATPGEDTAATMRALASALQHVRRTRRNESVVFDATMRAESDRRFTLQREMKRAAPSGEGFAVHLQPKVDIASGSVIGAEALLRWRYDGRPVSPVEFIPIAEASGLTEPLTDFVVAEIGRWARARAKAGAAAVPVAVNLSPIDLGRQGFAARLIERVHGAGLSPSTVEFEVTEGVAMQATPWAIDQLHILKKAGFRIALDDFGTGYSSLGNFGDFPIDTLKIDRSFVTPLTVATARESLAAVILAMTQTLRVGCVAEGVETDEQRQALRFLGCEVAQGYLFGKPAEIDGFDSTFGAKNRA
ncbi:MAG: EAL domain-containing protein [Alphaproteobacteria bacterium]|nr:EAL domain-containing protein [Alphaproteobacteria bacterium]